MLNLGGGNSGEFVGSSKEKIYNCAFKMSLVKLEKIKFEIMRQGY
jgi:hypothetical protein